MGSHSSETDLPNTTSILREAPSLVDPKLRGWMGYETASRLQKACWNAVGGQIKPEIVIDMAEVTCLAKHAALGVYSGSASGSGGERLLATNLGREPGSSRDRSGHATGHLVLERWRGSFDGSLIAA